MRKKLFAPECELIDERATKAQLPLQDMTLRVPRICAVCCHDRGINVPFPEPAADGLKLALDLVWERRCHDEVIVECDAELAADAKVWLETAG